MSFVVERVKQFIEEHYCEGISLAQVARALNYSPSYLTYVVRKETGRPITAWIIERRLAAARELLLTTKSSVTSVAEAVGFRDGAYFARQFARANGMTPARWRNRYLAHRDSFHTCETCGAHHFFEKVG